MTGSIVDRSDDQTKDETAVQLASPSSILPLYECISAESAKPTQVDDSSAIYEATTSGLDLGGTQHIKTENDCSAHGSRNLQAMFVWLSCNLTAETILLAMIGPMQYHLSFLDSFVYGMGGVIVGSFPVAFMSTIGAKSGLRTMLISRYSMGWLPAKVIALLNVFILIGYLVIDAVAAGQILSAVSATGSLSVIAGIAMSVALSAVISTVGMRLSSAIEPRAWLVQLVVICILVGVTAPNFDTSHLVNSDKKTTMANRISFFNLCLAGSITYAPCAADMFVHLPQQTTTRKVFLQALLGQISGFAVTFPVGIGLASGVNKTPLWQYAVEGSPGALIARSLAPLGVLGTVTGVALSLGVVANMIIPSYSVGVSLQTLSSQSSAIPRSMCSLAGLVLCTFCAVCGKEQLAAIQTNFISLMGYWVVIWVTIVGEEHFLFRTYMRMGYDWQAYDNPAKMPMGLASTTAFLSACASVVLCMRQTWFVGPVAALIGADGADIANLVGFGWTAVIFPFLRWVELRVLKR